MSERLEIGRRVLAHEDGHSFAITITGYIPGGEKTYRGTGNGRNWRIRYGGLNPGACEIDLLGRLEGISPYIHADHVRVLTPVEGVALVELLGRDLHEILQSGTLSPSQALTCLAQVAEGLKTMHDADIVHRDIKPSNILVTSASDSIFGSTKIIDLGLAAFKRGLLSFLDVKNYSCSPAYAAPEQIVGKYVPASDVFSLGASAHTVFTGKPPYWRETASKTVACCLAAREAPSLALIRPDLPRDLQRYITASLEPRAKRRPSLDEVSDVFSAAATACEGMPVLVHHSMPGKDDRTCTMHFSQIPTGSYRS